MRAGCRGWRQPCGGEASALPADLPVLFAVLVHYLANPVVGTAPPVVRIIGLFPPERPSAREAFTEAVAALNASGILEHEVLGAVSIVSSNADGLDAVCSNLAAGPVIGIVGPVFSEMAAALSAPLERLRIPGVSPSAVDPSLVRTAPLLRTILPSMAVQGLATVALARRARWKRIALLGSDDSYGAFGLLAMEQQLAANGVHVLMHVFPVQNPGLARSALRSWLQMDARVVVVHAYDEQLEEVLYIMQEEGLWGEGRVVLLPFLDVHFWVSRPGLRGFVGLLGVRSEYTSEDPALGALTYDATWALGRAVSAVRGASAGFASPDCSLKGSQHWALGPAVVEALPLVSFQGRSGNIAFAANGSRIGAVYELLNVQSAPRGGARVVHVGSLGGQPDWNVQCDPRDIQWTEDRKIRFGSSWPSSAPQVAHRHFKVLTKVAEPFVMLEANGRLRGYSIDVLEALAERLNFTTTVTVFPGTGTTDMLRQMVQDNYSFAISAITITGPRSHWLDFTQPYYHLGYRVLSRPGGQATPSLWAFFHPFAPEVWGLWVGLTFVVAVLYSTFERGVSKIGSRWAGPFGTGLWFAATVMLQEPDAMPRTLPGRLLGVASLFTSTIFVSAYTASLAAFLSSREETFVVSSHHDIIDGKIDPDRVGIIAKTSYEEWFLRVMSPDTEPRYVTSYQDLYNGITAGWLDATVVDAPIAEHIASRNCSLVPRGQVFEPAGYGIALPLGSPFTETLSAGLLDVKRAGVGTELYEKYFSQRKCNRDVNNGEAEQLSGRHLAGALAFTGICILLSLVVYAYEHRRKTRKRQRREERRLAEALTQEATTPRSKSPTEQRGSRATQRLSQKLANSFAFATTLGADKQVAGDYAGVQLAAPYTPRSVRAELDRHRRSIDSHNRAIWQLLCEAMPCSSDSLPADGGRDILMGRYDSWEADGQSSDQEQDVPLFMTQSNVSPFKPGAVYKAAPRVPYQTSEGLTRMNRLDTPRDALDAPVTVSEQSASAAHPPDRMLSRRVSTGPGPMAISRQRSDEGSLRLPSMSVRSYEAVRNVNRQPDLHAPLLQSVNSTTSQLGSSPPRHLGDAAAQPQGGPGVTGGRGGQATPSAVARQHSGPLQEPRSPGRSSPHGSEAFERTSPVAAPQGLSTHFAAASARAVTVQAHRPSISAEHSLSADRPPSLGSGRGRAGPAAQNRAAHRRVSNV